MWSSAPDPTLVILPTRPDSATRPRVGVHLAFARTLSWVSLRRRRLYASTPDEPATAWLYAVEMAEQLVTGDPLPSLYGTDMEGDEVDITASVAGRWAVVLFYRGDW
jgi:hypothetical protein